MDYLRGKICESINVHKLVKGEIQVENYKRKHKFFVKARQIFTYNKFITTTLTLVTEISLKYQNSVRKRYT